MTPGSGKFELRPARASDLDVIADVWHESASGMDGASNQIPSWVELRQRIDKELASGWSLHVAVRGEHIIGMLALPEATGTLDQIFVLPAEQGRGVGKALLDLAKRMLPGGFTLRTASSNTQRREFYEREGLDLTKEGKHPRTGASVCFYEWSASPRGEL